MENQNENQKVNGEVSEYFNELRNLLRKAPTNVTFFLNAFEDDKNNEEPAEAIIALNGSPRNLIKGLSQMMDHNEHAKEIITTSVEVNKLSNKGFGGGLLGALLAAHLMKR